MKKILITAVALIGLLTACGGTETTYTRADCKARLTKDMAYAEDHPDWAGNKVMPKECKDTSKAEVNKIVGEVVEAAINDVIDEEFAKIGE